MSAFGDLTPRRGFESPAPRRGRGDFRQPPPQQTPGLPPSQISPPQPGGFDADTGMSLDIFGPGAPFRGRGGFDQPVPTTAGFNRSTPGQGRGGDPGFQVPQFQQFDQDAFMQEFFNEFGNTMSPQGPQRFSPGSPGQFGGFAAPNPMDLLRESIMAQLFASMVPSLGAGPQQQQLASSDISRLGTSGDVGAFGNPLLQRQGFF